MKKFILYILLVLIANPLYADLAADLAVEHASKSLCLSGTRQSPVNITQVVPKQLPAIHLNYHSGEFHIDKDDSNTYIIPISEQTLSYENQTNRLVEVHFHQPGEHRINNQPYAMEAHFVHEAPDHHLVVIAQLFTVGKHPNKALERVILQMAWAHSHADTPPDKFAADLSQLLSKNHAYYTYRGSLTTEPCIESVTWLVLKDSQELTQDQVGAMKDIIGYNARTLQPINRRPIYSSIP